MTVLVESMKLRDAQKIPESTLLSSFQDLSTLDRDTNLFTILWLYIYNSKSRVTPSDGHSYMRLYLNLVSRSVMPLPHLTSLAPSLGISAAQEVQVLKCFILLGNTLLLYSCCLQSLLLSYPLLQGAFFPSCQAQLVCTVVFLSVQDPTYVPFRRQLGGGSILP